MSRSPARDETTGASGRPPGSAGRARCSALTESRTLADVPAGPASWSPWTSFRSAKPRTGWQSSLTGRPREHDRFILTRNGRPHAGIVSVAERESLQEMLKTLAAPEMRADLVEATSAEARGELTTEEEMTAIMVARLAQPGV
ncbi:type II toxin-antitoxin system prevent-host-death family antitoxin [Streptosporangium sp. NPDC051023]|uniref:type II toxin-antitoxin system Phd/YefM family antitoxin n=1 Tax=Streptosporangium sp. NPDC051023 TaxID=3155410 RepID=UPI00344F8072